VAVKQGPRRYESYQNINIYVGLIDKTHFWTKVVIEVIGDIMKLNWKLNEVG